jgi:spoIIIJ-associated protein
MQIVEDMVKTDEKIETDVWLEDFLTELLELSGLDLQIEELNMEEDTRTFAARLNGPDKSRAIGRDGQVLEALQHITVSAAANAGIVRDRLIVDVDEYRQRRDDRICDDANRLAREILESGGTCDLEPMSPRERRLVHMVISKIDGVTTESVGFGDDRFVRLLPSS